MTRWGARTALTATLVLGLVAGSHGEPFGQDTAVIVAREGARYWDHVVQRSPYMRMVLGLPIESLDYSTARDADRSAAFARALLQRLDAVDAAALSHEEVLDLEVLRWLARGIADSAPFYWFGFEVTPYTSPLPLLRQVLSTRQLDTHDDRALHLRLLDDGVAYIDSMQARLRAQGERGIRVPLQELDTVIPFVSSMIGDETDSMFGVHPDRLASVETEESSFFSGQVEARIVEANRALQEIVALLEDSA